MPTPTLPALAATPATTATTATPPTPNTVPTTIQEDPLELLLRQELEHELELAWNAYQSLAQVAWDSDATSPIVPPRRRQPIPPRQPPRQHRQRYPSHRPRFYQGRQGSAADDPIVLED